jgi:hypothetical protein
MTLPEYYQYLQQLPQQLLQQLQTRKTQQNATTPAKTKKRLVRKTFSRKLKP